MSRIMDDKQDALKSDYVWDQAENKHIYKYRF